MGYWTYTIQVYLLGSALLYGAHYVSPMGSHSAPYDTWATAATNIQSAIDEAYNSSSGSPIIVTDGVYYVSQRIILGFAGTVRSVNGPQATIIDGGDVSSCLWVTNLNAVVEGFTLRRGTSNNGGVWVSRGILSNCIVRDCSGLLLGGVLIDSSGTVVNCTIVSNRQTSSTLNGGGGVAISASGRLTDCTIMSNTANYVAGGVYCYGGGLVDNCVVAYNSALSHGGGLLVYQGGVVSNTTVMANVSGARGGGFYHVASGLVVNCMIASNTASSEGGGMYIIQVGGQVRDSVLAYNRSTVSSGGGIFSHSGGMVSNSIFRGNRAVEFGGGMNAYLAGSVFRCRFESNIVNGFGGGLSLFSGGFARNCVFYGNVASNEGGGVTLSAVNSTNYFRMLDNCTIVSNRAATNGAGLSCNVGGATCHVFNSLIYYNLKNNGNTENYETDDGLIKHYYSDSSPLHSGPGNLSANPDLVDRANGNLRIQSTSPCIDAGTNLADVVDDYDNVARPLNGDNSGPAIIDIGAYEYVHATADTDADQMPDSWESANGVSAAASNAWVDEDGDGLANLEEYIAGTAPTNAASLFQVAQINTNSISTGTVTVTWLSVTGRSYTVYGTTNLHSPTAWKTNLYNVPGSGGQMTYTNQDSASVKSFRISVTKP